MKENKTEIKKMVISIEGKDVVLSIEGAKKLREALNDLFGKQIVEEHHHHHHRNTWWWYENPVPYMPPLYTVTCGGTQTGLGRGADTLCLSVNDNKEN